MIEIDGSYEHRKKLSQLSLSDTLETPSVPLVGWEPIDNSNSKYVDKIPKVTRVVNLSSCSMALYYDARLKCT